MEKAKEDYLRVIYELEEGNKGVKSVEISKRLRVSKPSVSEMLRKLARQKLVKIEPYSKIFLTLKGRKQAEKIFDKYYTIKRFMKRFLNHNDEKASQESHKLEHNFSEESIKIIEKMLEENKEKIKPVPTYVG